jgi:hypothetical protein
MLSKLTCDFISNIINELRKEENKEIIEDKFLTPLAENISLRIHPYMMTIFCMYILMLVLIIMMIFILIRKLE